MNKNLLPISSLLCCLGLSASGQTPQLTLADVQTVIAQAVTRAVTVAPHGVVSVVDREGFVLGVWSVDGTTPATAAFTNLVADAIAKAGTASYLSSDQHAFTSRTAGFIVQQHFPPGIQNTPNGPLVGVNFSNLPFSDVNKFKAPGSVIIESSTPGVAIIPVPAPVTGGLDGAPGGVPLFKSGKLVGGVGVSGGDAIGALGIQVEQVATVNEDVALAGQTGYSPDPVFAGSNVFINGIRVAYIDSSTSLGAVLPFASLPGSAVGPFALMAAPPLHAYPTGLFGGSVCQIRQPIIADPSTVALGAARLTAAEVSQILSLAANRARTTRAGIRLPRGQPAQVFITVVNNPNLASNAPVVLGTIQTPGATMFSWDVAVQKARTAIFFSNPTRGFSSRTVGFLAQGFFPPGIADTPPGIFSGLQERFSGFVGTNPLNGATVSSSTAPNPLLPVDPNLPNGITIFPGGFPLYRNGVLIGAIGVSGDGVDQDDIIAASGTENFLAAPEIRGDQYFYRAARLPYAKFPRNPAL